MEFFERAHAIKKYHKKSSKSKENTKRQFKQMLHGYKTSDNEIIMQSAYIQNASDDSVSVGGFSDLNITNSSVEAKDEAAQETSNCRVLLENSFSNSTIDKDNSQELGEDSIDLEDDISLSEDLVFKKLLDARTSSSDRSLLSSAEDNSLIDDINSFDPDGALAARILKQIEKVENNNLESKKTNKKKPKKTLNKKNMCDDSVVQKQNYRGPYRPYVSSSTSSSPLPNDSSSETNSDYDEDSSPYVSISADNMQSQSLEHILGDYHHPTSKNLPTDFVFNSTNIFKEPEMNVSEIEIELESVDSLMPEVDQSITADDIELTAIDLDDSNTQLADSSYLNSQDTRISDTTLQSDNMSKQSIDSITNDNDLSPVNVYYGKRNCVFVLKHPAQLHIHGQVKVKCLGGTVDIHGYTLKDKLVDVYAPNCNYAQGLQTVEIETPYQGLFRKLTALGLTVAMAEEIVTTIGIYDGVVSMQPLRNKKIEFVKNNFTAVDLFKKQFKSENSLRKASGTLGCTLYMNKPSKSFKEMATWKQAIKCGQTPQTRGIVCGGKDVGKSTFLRYYVNKMLSLDTDSPVLVIDLDPGQCEFTPAGNVSATVVTEPLLGPNFTHLRRPEMMLNIGMINVIDNSKRYAIAVETLITYCYQNEALKNMRWIVNTMGMTVSLGLKFMVLIICLVKPTFVLQIDSNIEKKRFDSQLYPQTVAKLLDENYRKNHMFTNLKEPSPYEFLLLHHTENAVKSNSSLAPRDERYLNFLAYFGELDIGDDGLLGIVPYVVNLSDFYIGLNVIIDEQFIRQVLNGKIIALCQYKGDDNRKVFTLEDRILPCLGYGLLRGIDWETDNLYIVTPTCSKDLELVNALVYADWVPELRGLEKQVPAGTPIPYRTSSQYEQRELMFTPKRRFNPLQLLKMSRKS